MYNSIKSNAGWVSLEAEGFTLKGVRGQLSPAFNTKIFVGQVDRNLAEVGPEELKGLVEHEGTTGQVESDDCKHDSDNWFKWVTKGLMSAEIDPNEALLGRDILWCQGAAFHDDVPFNKIFCVMHIAGREGDLVFPRLKVRVPMHPGVFVIFDCKEPHAFLKPGSTAFNAADYSVSEKTFFAAQDLDPDAESVSYFYPAACRRKIPQREYVVDSLNGDYISPAKGT